MRWDAGRRSRVELLAALFLGLALVATACSNGGGDDEAGTNTGGDTGSAEETETAEGLFDGSVCELFPEDAWSHLGEFFVDPGEPETFEPEGGQVISLQCDYTIRFEDDSTGNYTITVRQVGPDEVANTITGYRRDIENGDVEEVPGLGVLAGHRADIGTLRIWLDETTSVEVNGNARTSLEDLRPILEPQLAELESRLG